MLGFKNIFVITITGITSPNSHNTIWRTSTPLAPGEHNGHCTYYQQRHNVEHCRKILHIKRTKHNNQINDKLTIKPNVIFEALFQKDSHRVHTTSQQPDHPHIAKS